MKVLITAGGTHEAIDTVRGITNYSTGRLGSIIANKFAEKNADITYICGYNAVLPSCKKAKIVPIKSTHELYETISGLLDNHVYECVIHSMAVSDFTPQAILTLDDIAASIASQLNSRTQGQNLVADIKEAILASGIPLGAGKLSSKTSGLMLLLDKTPKVIKIIKEKQPGTILVGFKLLSGVVEQELHQAAMDLLVLNSCDFVLANDLSGIKGNMHKAILIDKNGPLHTANTKHEIAEVIYKAVNPL